MWNTTKSSMENWILLLKFTAFSHQNPWLLVTFIAVNMGFIGISWDIDTRRTGTNLIFFEQNEFNYSAKPNDIQLNTNLFEMC